MLSPWCFPVSMLCYHRPLVGEQRESSSQCLCNGVTAGCPRRANSSLVLSERRACASQASNWEVINSRYVFQTVLLYFAGWLLQTHKFFSFSTFWLFILCRHWSNFRLFCLECLQNSACEAVTRQSQAFLREVLLDTEDILQRSVPWCVHIICKDWLQATGLDVVCYSFYQAYNLPCAENPFLWGKKRELQSFLCCPSDCRCITS